MQALLFDLDGTLADTDRLHEQAWIETLLAKGIKADHKLYQARISGRLNPDIARDLLPHLSEDQRSRICDEKEARFRALASNLEPTAGLVDLCEFAAGKGLKLAVVSNAPRANAEHILKALDLEFPEMVLSEDIGAGKPDPRPYQVALERLGVTAGQALAFEDSPSGVRSAVAAGIPTVGLSTGHTPEALQRAGAFLVVENFASEELWNLLSSHL